MEQDPTFLVGDRDERAVEPPLLGRLGRPALALDRKRVDVVAGELLQRGDQVGRDPLGDGGNLGPQRPDFPRRSSTGPPSTSQRDIDSTPPATTRSWAPEPMPMAATVIACCPEPQNRLSVMPGTRLGPSDQECGQAGDVVTVVAAQDPVPGDDVVDLTGVESHPGSQRR